MEDEFEETEKKSVVLKFSQAQKLLTEKRRELLQTLSQKEFNSITELSKELGRDKKNTSQDIKKLYQNGIIDLKDQGRSKKPVFKFGKIEIQGLEFGGNKEEHDSLEFQRGIKERQNQGYRAKRRNRRTKKAKQRTTRRS